MKTRPVIALLVGRSAIHAMFVARVVSASALGWVGIFSEAAYFALVDGTLAAMIAVLLFTGPARTTPDRLLRAGAASDASIRLAAGITILILPGVPHFAVAIVLFFAALGATAAFLGIVALIVVIGDRRGRRFVWPLDSRWSRVAFAGGGLTAIAIGWRLFVDPPSTTPQLRATAVVAAALCSIAFGLAALGEHRSRVE